MSEKKIYQLLEMVLWVLNPFLLVLAIWNQKIQPGLLLQWIGKLHPLALHFPIVFGMLIAVYFLFFQHRRFPPDTERLLLAINALFASGVVVCGLLLSKQNAYDGELINLHKWGGIAIALLSWLLLYNLNLKLRFKKYLAILFLIVLIGSTHKGAQLTHGVNALSFPQSSSETDIKTDGKTTLYEAGIAPILAQKCISCHGADKIKGNLQLDSPENILKGGKHGDILKGDGGRSALLSERIHLPQSDEKHMPPDGKMQLTPREKTILTKWVEGGSNFKIRMNELPQGDSIHLLTSKIKPESDRKVVRMNNLPGLEEFNSNYCTTEYLFNGTDEVEVDFFQGAFYNRSNLKKLEKIKSQIVRLNMQGIPLTTEDLNIIVQFKNLQKVNLNGTNLNIGSLDLLKSLPQLKTVSICGIEFDEAALDHFLNQSEFSALYVWTQHGTQKQLEKIIQKYPSIKIIVGDNLEDQILKISNPSIEQDSLIIADHLDVKLKHLLRGTSIRYTTDGSDPDSLTSIEYKDRIRLSQNTVLKIRAFKAGWKSSDIVQKSFYKSEIHPDSIYLLTIPDPKHRARGAKTLIDYDLGENNRYTDKWLGYKDSNLEFVIGFNQPKLLKSAYLNAYVELGPSIFPISAITVQGSNDGKQFRLISETRFPVAKKEDPSGAKPFTCNFPQGTSYRFYKFIVSNLKKMPVWKKENKGKPAWIFVDELFLN
jgi:hypothetical protein